MILTRHTNNDKYASTYGGKYCCRVWNNYGCIHIINALEEKRRKNKQKTLKIEEERNARKEGNAAHENFETSVALA